MSSISANNKLPGLIFDLDDLLFSPLNGFHDAMKNQICTAGKKFLDAAGLVPVIDKKGYIANFPQMIMELGKISLELQTQFLKCCYDVPYTEKEAAEKDIFVEEGYGLKINWSLVQAISEYTKAGGKVGIYTSGPAFHAMKVLQEIGLAEYFTEANIVDIVKMGEKLKPTLEGYKQACDLLGFEPGNTWYFDDSAKSLKGAKKADAKTFLVNRAGNKVPAGEEPDIMLNGQNSMAYYIYSMAKSVKAQAEISL